MIKRTNPINKNKQELAKELIAIRDKQIKVKESQIPSLNALKTKLIDLKVNMKDSMWSGMKSRIAILSLMNKLVTNGIDSEKLEELNERSIKEVAKIKSESDNKSFGNTMIKSNEELINRLLVLINSTIISFKKEIKNWQSKKKTHLKTFKIGKK